MKPVDALSSWSSHLDLDKKDSNGKDPLQGVASLAHRGVVGAHEAETVPLQEKRLHGYWATILTVFHC